jgi:hypothetical protein
MRSALLALVACAPHATCPTTQPGFSGDTLSGTACALPSSELCFVVDQFSGCASAWYRCVGDRWTVDHGLPSDGQACGDAPISECSIEGNPDCDTEPTSGGCGCGSDGIWRCFCSCYGGRSDCGGCPSVPRDGTLCEGLGAQCAYPGTTCTCTAQPDSSPNYGVFVCA